MLEFLARFTRAVLGAILFTTIWLMDIVYSGLLLTMIATVLATDIYMLIQMGPINAFFSMASFTLENPLVALCMFVLIPISAIDCGPLLIREFVYSIVQLILAPFKGAYHGYQYGMNDVLQACLTHLADHSAWVKLDCYDYYARGDVDPLVDFDPVAPVAQRARAAPPGPVQQPNRRPQNGVVTFNALAYTEAEWDALLATAPALSIEEKARFSRYPVGTEIARLYASYLQLEDRLNTDVCPILYDRPTEDNALIFVKQYHDGAQWKPVPGQSFIYDRSSFGAYLGSCQNPVNPCTNERILNPGLHRGHETRFRMHPFYGNRHPQGFSQELSEKAIQLRAYPQPRSHQPGWLSATLNTVGLYAQPTTETPTDGATAENGFTTPRP